MKTICKISGYFIGIIGTIGSFIMAKEFGVSNTIKYLGIYTERNWILTIAIFIGSMAMISSISFILLGISDVLKKIENQEMRREEKGYDNKLRKIVEEEEEKEKKYWRCPKCGEKNPPYPGTCSCGYSRR